MLGLVSLVVYRVRDWEVARCGMWTTSFVPLLLESIRRLLCVSILGMYWTGERIPSAKKKVAEPIVAQIGRIPLVRCSALALIRAKVSKASW